MIRKFCSFVELFYLHFFVKIYEAFQQRRVRKLFYHDPIFHACDQALLKRPNPYHVKEAFPYGETPLCSLKEIADRFGLQSSDRVVDLGCGRGRGVFFLSQFYGCQAHGIDQVPDFIERAQTLAQQHQLKRTTFSCGDLRNYDFSEATFVFFYATTFSELFMDSLCKALQALPKEGRVVTVSTPLPGFEVIDQFEVGFPWGWGEVFLQTLPVTQEI